MAPTGAPQRYLRDVRINDHLSTSESRVPVKSVDQTPDSFHYSRYEI